MNSKDGEVFLQTKRQNQNIRRNFFKNFEVDRLSYHRIADLILRQGC